eukprot:3646435-Amphidinium_carterae.2
MTFAVLNFDSLRRGSRAEVMSLRRDIRSASVNPHPSTCSPCRYFQLISDKLPSRSSSTTSFHHSSLHRSRSVSSVTPCNAPFHINSLP